MYRCWVCQSQPGTDALSPCSQCASIGPVMDAGRALNEPGYLDRWVLRFIDWTPGGVATIADLRPLMPPWLRSSALHGILRRLVATNSRVSVEKRHGVNQWDTIPF